MTYIIWSPSGNCTGNGRGQAIGTNPGWKTGKGGMGGGEAARVRKRRRNPQGNSEGTCSKQERHSKVARQRLIMTKNWGGVFYYIETNAGGPWNHEAGCKSSA